jgi:hypothetical protein
MPGPLGLQPRVRGHEEGNGSHSVEGAPETRGRSGPVLFLPSPGLAGYVLLGDDAQVSCRSCCCPHPCPGTRGLFSAGLSGRFFSTIDPLLIGVAASNEQQQQTGHSWTPRVAIHGSASTVRPCGAGRTSK